MKKFSVKHGENIRNCGIRTVLDLIFWNGFAENTDENF